MKKWMMYCIIACAVAISFCAQASIDVPVDNQPVVFQEVIKSAQVITDITDTQAQVVKEGSVTALTKPGDKSYNVDIRNCRCIIVAINITTANSMGWNQEVPPYRMRS